MPASARELADLFHHRWAVPVLAEVSTTPAAGRIAALGRRLGAGRQILRRTVAALGERGLVRKNPGYGHPLRPEFLLTRRGIVVGAWCETFVREIRRKRLERVVLRKWSMPVLLAVRRGGRRFSELETALLRAPSYRTVFHALDRPPVSLARAAALLMLLYTHRYYRTCALRAGLRPWEATGNGTGLVLSSLPAVWSRSWARRACSRVERDFLGALRGVRVG